MKIICFGDSNTYGYDPREPFGGRYERIWPELLSEITGWDVHNWGENGREVPKQSMIFPEDTDLLIIMLGTNDLLQFWSPEAACEKMERFLASVTLDPKKILLVAPPTMAVGEWVQDQELIAASVTLARCYESLAKKLGTGFADAGTWHIPMAFDGVHITQEGHIAFADHLYAHLTWKELNP